LSPDKKIKGVNSLQDILFLAGIITFTSILVIGLFPGRLDAGLVDENFFITTMMTIPIIAGIYFIIISFRRSLNIKSIDIRQSIKKKITLSFVFIAVLSAMPIVIISSSYFNKNLSKMFSGRTMKALDESVELTHDIYSRIEKGVRSELRTVKFILDNFMADIDDPGLEKLAFSFKESSLKLIFFKVDPGTVKKFENQNTITGIDNYKLYNFYKSISSGDIRTDRMILSGVDIISGMFRYNKLMVVSYLPIPPDFKTDEELFLNAREDYRKIENQKEYFESGVGSFLMFLSIVSIVIAYIISLYISGNITSPVMELSSASKQIAMGNNKLFIEKKSEDELGVLVDAFNSMARQLDENQKFMFQKQKLEAWNEMARKLVHEIKNPLTPIRLSAERMRKLVLEKNPNMPDAVLSGSETIISEVNSLLKLVVEFNNFARLPVKRAELSSLNELAAESISLFHGYENVEFIFQPDDTLSDIMIDRSLVRQALNNIINNSIQAFSENGTVVITTGINESGLYQFVNIKDNGPGIKESDIERIFEPGFTLKKNGSGLGLAIVEKIMFEHDGKIFCNSKEGEGAEFRLMFPFVQELSNGQNISS
jgi:nitrogen fixation/metabolism regulation signal transduction histidine kinase